jgi:hypothetical protein
MFSIRLETSQSVSHQNYDIEIEEIENIQDLLYYVCEGLEDYNLAKFIIEGFGKSPWPVDISTDLLSVLDQLPDFLKFLDDPNCDVECLDFYEQGIQRRIIFNKQKNTLEITCKPFSPSSLKNNTLNTDWGNSTKEYTIEKKEIKNMICKLIVTFISLTNEYFPELKNNQFFREWCENKYFVDCVENTCLI